MRIGLLLDSFDVPGWVEAIIRSLEQSGKVSWSFVAVNAEPATDSRAHLPYRVLRMADRLVFQHHTTLFHRVKAGDFSGVPLLTVKPVFTKGRNSFSGEDLLRVRNHNPDLILRFGFGILSGEILTLPRLGVWSLHHGVMEHFRGGPPGFWEWYHRYPVSGVTLQRLTEELDGGICLAQTLTRTDFNSFGRNQSNIFSKGIDLMIDMVLAEAAGKGTGPGKPFAGLYSGPLYRDPKLLQVLLGFAKVINRNLPPSIRKIFFREQWSLFYSIQKGDGPALNFRKYKQLLPPADRSWADPFIIQDGERYILFVEELCYQKGKGHITCIILDHSGRMEACVPVLEKDYHLSYPYVFKHEEKWYMIPESAENRSVDLYVCESFPFDWKFCKTLISGIECFDSTLLLKDNYFWLFCTVRKRAGASPHDDLHIYYTSDLLEGDWVPHQKNPVLSNPEQARPAGSFFYRNGQCYRPSQVCVPRYGYAISINEVLQLTPEVYQEKPIVSARPDWRPELLTMHTLNFSGNLSVTDGQMARSRVGVAPHTGFSILFVMDSMSTGGAEYSTLSLAGWLRQNLRWEVKVAFLKDKRPAYNPSDFGLEGCIALIDGGSPMMQWFRLKALVRQMRPAIVHSVLLYSNFFCRLIRVFVRTPVYVESLVNRTYDEARFRDPRVNAFGLRVFRRLDQWTQKFGTDYFHAVTEDIQRHFQIHTRTPAEKIAVVYRGRKQVTPGTVETRNLIRAELGISPQATVFLTAGRHEYQKGQMVLLRAFKILLEEDRRLGADQKDNQVLLIAGREGEETTRLRDYINRHGLQGNIRLLGHRDDLVSIMTASDVFVLPSHFEGIGGVLIEAEAAGLPVICSALDGLREVVEEGRNAVLVRPGDSPALAAAMSTLSADARLRESFSAAGRKIFSERFLEAASHENMKRFYLDRLN